MMARVAILFVAALMTAVAVTESAPATSSLKPPIVVNLTTPPNVSETLVALVLEESDAIWRSAGFTFVWQRSPRLTTALNVVMSDETRRSSVNHIPLGWILFNDGIPSPDIVISRTNAKEYLNGVREVAGSVAQMTRAEYEMLLGRLMGRALAHELAHYLLASKEHTLTGILQATHTAHEFFSLDRSAFRLDAGQRRTVADRLMSDTRVAAR